MHSLGPRDCPDIRILIRFDARRPVAPRLADGYWNLRHGYNAWIKQIQKEERFQSGKCANYWDCTRDWNGGILVFPRDGNFVSPSSFGFERCWFTIRPILLKLRGLFGREKIGGIGELKLKF